MESNSKYYAILWSQTPYNSLLFYYLLEIICEKFKEICGFFLQQETNDFLTLKKQGATRSYTLSLLFILYSLI